MSRLDQRTVFLFTLALVSSGPAALAESPVPIFTNYTPQDADLNRVNTVVVDGQTVWFGTRKGVVEWNAATDTVRTYTPESHGLPGSPVEDVTVDSAGDVWIAAWGVVGEEGIARRDRNAAPGEPWVVYDQSNSPLRTPLSITADPQGGVWVGTFDQGAFFFDGATWVNFNPDNSGLGDPLVDSIVVDPAGNKWMGTFDDVYRFDGTSWVHFDGGNTGTPSSTCSAAFSPPPHELGLISGFVRMLGVDPVTGTIWMGCVDDGPCVNEGTTLFDGSNWSTYSVWNSNIKFRTEDVAVDSAGRTWVVSQNGVQTFDEEEGFADHGPPGAPAHAYCVATIGEDVWIGSGRGVARLRAGQRQDFTFGGLLGQSVLDVAFRPTEGGAEVWIGHDLGVQRVDGDLWEYFYPDNRPMAWSYVRAVEVDIDGSVWIADGQEFPQSSSHPGSVHRVVGNTWTTYTIDNSGLVSNQVADIAIDPVTGEKWFAYYDISVGMTSFDGTTWTHYDPQSCGSLCGANCVPSHFIRDIEIDASGVKWIANEGCGLVRFDGQTWTTFGEEQGLARRFAKDLALAPDGSVWVATSNGVSRLVGQQITSFLPGQDVREIAVDHAGRVWAGVYDVGVAVYDGGQWTTFSTADGLVNNRIRSIEVHPNGDVWLGTENGLSIATVEAPCPGDLDGDGQISLDDLTMLLQDFGCQAGACSGDVDGDGDTDLDDLTLLLQSFGQACQ
jgi:ligand-binding sensor domain-containing protein